MGRARACVRVFFVAMPTAVDVKDRDAAPAQQCNRLHRSRMGCDAPGADAYKTMNTLLQALEGWIALPRLPSSALVSWLTHHVLLLSC